MAAMVPDVEACTALETKPFGMPINWPFSTRSPARTTGLAASPAC